MPFPKVRCFGPILAALTLAALAAPEPARSATRPDRLDNGMQTILIENHASPMIASVIFVRSGSKYESEYENGITHFLEHLLFDGTTHLTREELSNSIRDLGGYVNAYTREDLTAYLVLLPKQYIEYGMTVQADMLFNSVFPENELAKERQVVIEEIRRDADAPDWAALGYFRNAAYGATDYGRPVLGYEPFIANIPRAAIIQYWKTHYSPDNITVLVIGDFDAKAMKPVMARIFGRIPKGTTPPDAQGSDLHRKLAETKQRAGGIIQSERYDTVAAGTTAQVNFSIAAPHLKSADYLPFDLLTQYLALDEISPLKRGLQSGDHPLASEVSVSLTTRAEFSRLDISVLTESPQNCDSIVAGILSSLTGLGTHAADPNDLKGIQTGVRCSAIYDAEKLHYYAFQIAPMMMSAGWDWIQRYPDRLDSITWEQCHGAAERWLAQPKYVVTVVKPADSGQVGFQPKTLSAAQVIAHFDSTTFPVYDLTKGYELKYPQTDSVAFSLTDKAVYRREVLPDGLTVLVKSSRDSRVFAVNVLGKNRSACEPDDKAGITDFVNRCLPKGTTTRNARQVNRDLAAIGANLTVCDNPWIPYDDRYTTRSFAFVKFETIEPFAREGFDLLTDLLRHPAFDSVEVENVRTEMLSILGRSSGSPSQAARDLFYARMFANHEFAKGVMGNAASVGSITANDLRQHHLRFYAPGNMILSIVTSRDTSEVMAWVRSGFGAADPVAQTACPAPGLPGVASGEIHQELAKEQIAIYAGGRLPGVESDDALTAQVAVSILSSRLNEVLRQRQGLAYSTGAGSDFQRGFGWYVVNIATSSQNYQAALDGLSLQTEKLALDGPRDAEVKGARNQIWGQLMSAKLSRINQAYYLALDEFLGREPGYDKRLLGALSKVTSMTVRDVASRYLRPELWVIATAGKKP
jgi:zinc protease